MRTLLLIVLFLGLASASPAGAASLDLNVALEQDLLEAGRAQTTFLRVGLRGRPVPRQNRPPLNLALVLDRSGSMQGSRLDQARQAALYALNLLGPEDVLSLITYESQVQVLAGAAPVSDKPRLARLIQEIRAGGSTALYAGVAAGAQELRRYLSPQRINRVLLLSDGLANVGPGSPAALAQLGAALGAEGISVTTIGLGLGYNEDLMTRLAAASDGNHAFVADPFELVQVFDREFQDLLAGAAGDVELTIRCAPGVRPLRVLGREAEIIGQNVRLRMNQVFSGQEKYALLEVALPPGRGGSTLDLASVELRYQDLAAQSPARSQASAQARFSSDPEQVRASVVPVVVQAVAEQKTAAATDEAVRLRDEGKVDEARDVLQTLSRELGRLSNQAPAPAAPALRALAEESAAAAQALESEDWNTTRKTLRAEQYELQNQSAPRPSP